MPRGDKSKYTDKQRRKADHIAEGYEERGLSEEEADAQGPGRPSTRSRAVVTSQGADGGKPTRMSRARKAGRMGGKASAKRPAAARSASAKKAAATRKKRAASHTK